MASSLENDYIFLFEPEGTLTGTTMLGQSGPESNGNEGVLYIPQSSRIGSGVLVLRHINLCGSFNAKHSLYKYVYNLKTNTIILSI